MPDLLDVIKQIVDRKDLQSYDERTTELALVLPILDALGWKVFDPKEVIAQYAVGKDRVDYALCADYGKKVLCEAKDASTVLGVHEQQLVNYAFEEGAELAVLTNGLTWWLYLPLLGVPWQQRKFSTVDLQEQSAEDAAQRLMDFLSKEAVCTGRSKTKAEEFHRSRQNKQRVRETLPIVWNEMLAQPDKGLLDLLSHGVEHRCGVKPLPDDVKAFLNGASVPAVTPATPPAPPSPQGNGPRRTTGENARRVQLGELVSAGLLRDGDTLTLFYHELIPNEKAQVVAAQNKLKYLGDGRLYSVSSLAKQLLQEHGQVSYPWGVQGPLYWKTQDGRLLHELNEQVRRRRGDRN